MLAVLQGQYSPFGTTLFRPIIQRVAELSGKPYDFGENDGLPAGQDARRMRRIAEHARASAMLMADGVRPGNEGRDYVLRRVMRRAIRDGIQLGLTEPFLGELLGSVIAAIGETYPALVEGRETLRSVFDREEQRFRETYDRGVRFLEQELAKLGAARPWPARQRGLPRLPRRC